MFEIKVQNSIVSVQETDPLYSGSAEVHTCRFTFDANWERFAKSAVFRVGGRVITAVVDEDGCCALPWELLTRANIGLSVEVGLYGVSAEAEILTSVWDSLGTVRDGSEIGNDAREPGAGVYDQVMASVQQVNDRIGNYSSEMMGLLQRAESAARVASDSAAVSVKNESTAVQSAQSAQADAASAKASERAAESAAARAETAKNSAAESAVSAKTSGMNAAQSATDAEKAAARAQAEAERVSVPAAVGVYNVVLTDRVTAEKYALIVEDGRIALLGVSADLDSAEVNLVDNTTGTAYEVIVENGIIKLKEV